MALIEIKLKKMKDLAVSMNFDLSKYQSNDLDKDASEDSLKKVLNSVSNILSDKNWTKQKIIGKLFDCKYFKYCLYS